MTWHPPDTAPKDGTWILGRWTQGVLFARVIRWDKWTGKWNDGYMALEDPNLWMEVPEVTRDR